jgi:hypothetical protein
MQILRKCEKAGPQETREHAKNYAGVLEKVVVAVDSLFAKKAHAKPLQNHKWLRWVVLLSSPIIKRVNYLW